MTCNAAAYRTPVLIELARQDSTVVSGLHIFVMTQNLQKGGGRLPLNLTPGYILVFKSSFFNLAKEPYGGNEESYLDLYNENDDIILRMIFRAGQKKIFCNDRASKSIGDGWGKERSTDLGLLDLEKMKRQSVAISLRVFWTESRITRYQILLDLNTMCYFDSRFPGPATQMSYSYHAVGNLRSIQLSESVKVACFKFSDLQPEELRAIESGAPSPKIPAFDSMAISIRPSHFVPNQTYASISWDDGKEIRIYHLGPGNILQEFAYSESKDRNDLYYGDLHKLKIVLDPTLSIAAVRHQDDGICIYYQDPNDGFIRTVRKSGPTGEWRNDPAKVARAVKASSIAAIMDVNGPDHYRVYYQDPELHLKECYYNTSASRWVAGDFNPGVQPRGTPITAEVVNGGDVDLNVTWRDAQGCVASSSRSKSWGWDLHNGGLKCASGDGQD